MKALAVNLIGGRQTLVDQKAGGGAQEGKVMTPFGLMSSSISITQNSVLISGALGSGGGVSTHVGGSSKTHTHIILFWESYH